MNETTFSKVMTKNGWSPKKSLKGFFLAAFFLIFLVTERTDAQVSAYGFSESLVAYAPLGGTPTVAHAAPWDDQVIVVALPFSFVIDGTTVTDCRINTNGFITFGTAGIPGTNFVPLQTNGGDGVASAMGLDLISNGDPIVYATLGAAPNRTFVVQWTNAQRKGDGAGSYTFQIRLRETSNIIEFSYGACSTTSAVNKNAQVGLRGLNNVFLQGNVINRTMAANNEWFNNTTAGTANNVGIRTSNVAYPDLGLRYTWTPAAPCTTPTAQPTNLILGATSINATSINGNSFTPASPAPTNYLVLRSTENTPPTAATLPNRTFPPNPNGTIGIYTVVSKTNATTFNQTGLQPETTYYYWVISYNSDCFGAPFYNWTNILSGSATTCTPQTVALDATNIGGNSFDANWTAVPSATHYEIDVSTNSAFTAILPGYNGLSVGNVTTFTVTGLSSMTQYWYRVRAIGSGCSLNSIVKTVTTTCGYYEIPYVQNFDTTNIGIVPQCFVRNDLNGDNFQWGVQTVTYTSSPKSILIAKNTTLAMNDWFFLPGLNLTGAVSYRLRFWYRTNVGPSQAEVLKVFLGDSNTPGGMTQTLIDLTNITNTNFVSVYVDFTPVVSGVYYIGFEGASMADQSYIAIDDVSVTLAPTCLDPTDVTVATVGTNTATITWVEPLVPPANGYQYYLSTSPTPPTGATTPTGSVPFGSESLNLTGLTASTTYYIWIRGNCSASDKSVWTLEQTFSTECSTPSVVTTTPASRCGPGTLSLSATASSGATIQWYDSPTGDNIIATGNSYVTPFLTSTATYYAEAKALGAVAKAGPVSPAAQGGTLGIQNYQASVTFTVLSPTTLQAIDIFPLASGQSGSIVLRNSSNLNLQTYNFTTTVAGGSTPQTIAINYTLTPGNYLLYLSNFPASGLRMNESNAFYPYSCSVAEITGNIVSNTQFLAFYNWRFTTECRSPRVAVNATISSPPALTLSDTESTICQGESTPAITVSGHGSYNNLTWTPNTGVSGSFATGFTFNPVSTTTYTLSAAQTTGSMCTNEVSITINVNPSPPPVAIIPSTPTITLCEGAIQPLNGSVGAMSTASILEEDFNGASIDWTVANTSTDGNTDASQWTQRTSTYVYSSGTWNISLKSNDNSKFFFANADAQGSSGITFAVTRTTLTSPVMNLVGYTSAQMSFWHYMRYILGDSFTVEASTDGGGSWSVVHQFIGTQGTPLNFANAVVDLNAYAGLPNVQVRFNFISNWGYGWAVDNVSITGSIASALAWSPAEGLYNDPDATDPYVEGTPATIVYAKPLTSTVYTATASNAAGCLTTGSITVNVDEAPEGGELSSSQALCSGIGPADIALTNHSGNVVRWESADDPDFTVNVANISNTTTTLTAADMGTVTTIKYFRAVVSNGVCPNVYSTVSSVSFPTTVWNGSTWTPSPPTPGVKAVFNGNYTATADLYACAVQVNSGTVTVNSGVSFIIENEVNVAGGSLVFEDDASLIQINNVANTGSIVYKRNTTPIKKFDYTYWSSPVAGQTLGALSPNTNPSTFYTWDTVVNNWVPVSTATVMAPAKGYIVRAPDIAPFNASTPNVFNATLNGVPNNGDYSIPILASGTSDLNLLGNPYPSAIDIDSFFLDSDNASLVDATIYLWTHNTPITNNVYTNNDYAVYNLLGGVGTSAAINPGVNLSVPTGKVAAGQSFFIHGLANGNATFKNSMRVIGNNGQFFRVSNAALAPGLEKHRLWLEIKNEEGAYKQIMIGYVEGATLGKDWGFDGPFVDGGNNISFYSFGPEKLSIQGRPTPFNNADQVLLGYHTDNAGIFEINLAQFDGLFNLQDVWLEDKVTGIVHNLKVAPYSFTTVDGTFDDRFILRYTSGSLGVPQIDPNSIAIINDGAGFQINSGHMLMSEVNVFDVRGRKLMTLNYINDSHASLRTDAANQVLLVRITLEGGAVVTKKVIR